MKINDNGSRTLKLHVLAGLQGCFGDWSRLQCIFAGKLAPFLVWGQMGTPASEVSPGILFL